MILKRIALAWLRAEDWPAWCEMDPDFQRDYRHWLKRMEAAEAKCRAAGIHVERIVIEPDEFAKWSKANGRGLGTADRAAFAAWKAAHA